MRDSAEFDAFYAATSHRLLGQVYAMTGNLCEAEDALQEAYIQAWRHWPKIREYQNPEGWVRSIAFKLCVNAWWKARNRIAAHRRASAAREDAPPLGPDLLVVVEALRKLPDKHRRALVLHYIADLSVEQIAAETGAAPGTVKSWLARGRRALAPWVSEFADEPAAGRPAEGSEQAEHTERIDLINPIGRSGYDYA